jgi:hypothetical protein
VKGALTSPKVKHRPAITDPVALGGLLRAIDGFSGQPSTIAALKLLPLVFSHDCCFLEPAPWRAPSARTR